jgi:thiosulfate/3-mercaptopyruvate sulfurtransferase
MGQRPIQTGSLVSRSSALFCALGISSLIIAITICTLSTSAFAGTENGSFCPTCPDWNNLEGWLAQKDAYEQSQHTGPYAAESVGATGPVNNSDNNGGNKNIEKAAAVYPKQYIIAQASSLPRGFVIVDVRSPKDYLSGHIPGARNVYWKSLQSDSILDPALAENALRKAGINNSDKILICGDSDEGPSFMFWALCYLGQRNLCRMDGGMDAAWSAGMKPSTNQPSIQESNYTMKIVPWLRVNRSNIETFLKMNGIQILDARDFTDYGRCRLTNASIPFQPDKLYDDYKMKDAGTLMDLLELRGLSRNGTQLIYGTPQAYDLFYGLRLMGYNATLLDGDWWTNTGLAVSNIK